MLGLEQDGVGGVWVLEWSVLCFGLAGGIECIKISQLCFCAELKQGMIV